MAHFFVRPFSAELQPDWASILKHAGRPHFFFTRKFMPLENEASVLVYKNKTPVAFLPATQQGERQIISHPKMSFGGLIFTPALHLHELPQVLLALFSHYSSLGFSELVYKATPAAYFPQAEGLLPWLLRCSATLPKVELNALLPLQAPLVQDNAHKLRQSKKAEKEGVFFLKNKNPHFLWEILEAQLWEKHKQHPTHSAKEFRHLMRNFPTEVQLWEAHHPTLGLCAGAGTFQSSQVLHTQYLTSSSQGQKLGALSFLVQHLRQYAQHQGLQFLSLGVSEERQKNTVNSGLLRWKSEFGAFGAAHYTFQVSLPEASQKLSAILAL